MHIDILSIHYRIIDYLNGIANKEMDILNHEEYKVLRELKTQFTNNHSLDMDTFKKDMMSQMKTLENNIEQIQDKSLLYFYLLKTQPIIEKYQQALHTPVVIDFMKCDDPSNDKNHQLRESLIREYFYLIKKFFASFSFIHTICDCDAFDENLVMSNNTLLPLSDHMHCLKCGNKSSFETFDNQNVCGECGIVLDQFNQQGIISFKDSERVNMNSKYTYDRKTHFKDCLYQFQGKQNVSIHRKVYQDILDQLVSYSIIPSNYKDLPKEMAFEQVTKEHIFLFLKQTNHVKHYEDATLIFHELTGKPIPDISFLEEQLIQDFDMLVEQYDRKYRNTTDRKNFINTQYILYQLLNRHHYPCSKDDFNMLKTIDRRYYHDEICGALFEELGWNHQPIF